MAPLVIAESDFIVTLPERVALLFAKHLELAMLDPPVALSTFSLSQLWHERTHESPAHHWLREQIAAASTAQSRAKGKPKRKSRAR